MVRTSFFKRALILSCTLLALFVSSASTYATETKPVPKKNLRPHFVLTFEPTAIETMTGTRDFLINSKYIEAGLELMSKEFRLPKNIPVTFKDCGFENAYWDPDKKEMVFCYEIIDMYRQAANSFSGNTDLALIKGLNSEGLVLGTTVFILSHELGHALVDLYQIPITGKEEDAVDQFATFSLINKDDKGKPIEKQLSQYALAGAVFFKSLAKDPSKLSEKILADEHSLGQQRYYDVMCLVLGSDPDVYGPVIAPGLVEVMKQIQENPKLTDREQMELLQKSDDKNILPGMRAIRCDMEYKRYGESWERLIDTYILKAKSKLLLK